MNLTKRIVTAILLLAPLPAMAQDDTPSLLISSWQPPARAPTAGERSAIPATPYDYDTDDQAKKVRDLTAALGVKEAPRTERFTLLTSASVQWGAVPQANRALLNCVRLSTDWNVAERAVIAKLDNRCGVSIRIHAGYGFKPANGKCVATASMDGIILPGFGRKPLNWSGSDDRTQTACFARIETLGIPQWPVDLARAARGWMIDEARSGQIYQLNIYDSTGNSTALGTGSGKITDAQSGDLCALSLTSPAFGQYGKTLAAKTLNIRWTDVAEVQDVSYNSFASLKFKGAVGNESWSLDFTNFKPSLATTGLDGTIAMAMLSEYCRNADGG